MEPMIFVLALFGCGDDQSSCQRLGRAPAAYSSKIECLAAANVTLTSYNDEQFPLVTAKCEQRGLQTASRR